MNLEAAIRDLADQDPRVRAKAADALGRVESEPARAAALAAKAAADPHPAVRYAALLSLGELGAFAEWEAARAALGDAEPLVREAGAIALGPLGAAAAQASSREVVSKIWAALEEALASGAPEVRFQAVASLAEIDAPRSAPAALRALDDADAKVRAHAACALGDAGDDKAREPLAGRLKDCDEVAWESALALARLGDRRGSGKLVEALADRDRALDAAGALAQLGCADDATVRDALGRELGRFFGDPLVKVRAAEALAKAGDPRGKPHLEKAARSSRDDVRGLASDVLKGL